MENIFGGVDFFGKIFFWMEKIGDFGGEEGLPELEDWALQQTSSRIAYGGRILNCFLVDRKIKIK